MPSIPASNCKIDVSKDLSRESTSVTMPAMADKMLRACISLDALSSIILFICINHQLQYVWANNQKLPFNSNRFPFFGCSVLEEGADISPS